MPPIAFFERESSDLFVPTRFARSLWAPQTLSGPPVCAIAARAAETEFCPEGFRGARFTIELFKAAREIPTTTRGRMSRDGGRIKVVEVDVVQDFDGVETVVARSTSVFVKETSNPPGDRWIPADDDFRPPTAGSDDLFPWFGSDDENGEPAWDQTIGNHQNARRKRMWTRAVWTVAGERPSPFERAVISGESTSLMGNWGSTGIGFINCDLTVGLSRLPDGPRIGLEAVSHTESDGISTSTTHLYDIHGQFGVGLVTGLNNAAAEIDFTSVDTTDRYTEA
ncbi:acyl-CoA thioesterase domain-containing protein [Gordonia sp. CPCC 205515]|uniref:acyl-CoA thioesterase domain-containing protein n=1 Tax=Gordonia sp. CPCC 205515 TaxID=3140791 RepID=UPI003AF3C53C